MNTDDITNLFVHTTKTARFFASNAPSLKVMIYTCGLAATWWIIALFAIMLTMVADIAQAISDEYSKPRPF